jgi:hypothetical protein
MVTRRVGVSSGQGGPAHGGWFRFLGLALALGLLAGCAGSAPAPTTIVLPASFWQDKEVRVGIATVALPKGAEHMVGPQDALDRVIARKIDERLINYLETVQPREFGKMAQTFADRLRARGYTVKVIAEPLARSPYAEIQSHGAANILAVDLASVRTQYGVDRLVLLSVDRFGVYRDYFVFVATAPPQAIFQAHGALIDLTTNEMLWQVSMAEKQNVIPIEGMWDQPPDYPNLASVLRFAERAAGVFLENAFFAGAP